jgi:hypothetical protein
MMEIKVNLTKAELDLVEEALLQYRNLLEKSKEQNPEDQMVGYELTLCDRVFEEFGLEELGDVQDQQVPNGQFPPGQYPFSR